MKNSLLINYLISLRVVLWQAFSRPFMLFFCEPILQVLSLYISFVYGLLYRKSHQVLRCTIYGKVNHDFAVFLTTLIPTFQGVYHESLGISGLNYIALSIGLTGATQISARQLDKWYNHLKAKRGGVGKPEYRLPPLMPGTILLPAGLLIAGWASEKKAPWIVTDIVRAVISLTYSVPEPCRESYLSALEWASTFKAFRYMS